VHHVPTLCGAVIALRVVVFRQGAVDRRLPGVAGRWPSGRRVLPDNHGAWAVVSLRLSPAASSSSQLQHPGALSRLTFSSPRGIQWCGQQREGDVFADACFCGSGTAWIAPDYKQPGIDSAVCLQFGSNWGWHMLGALCLLGSLYAVGGVAVARRVGAKELGIRAHPHARQWQELGAICSDGLAFARNKCRAPSATEQLLPKRRDYRDDSAQPAGRTSKRTQRAKKASKSSQKMVGQGSTSSGSSAHCHNGSKQGHEVESPPAPGPEIAGAASGGAAGLGSSAAGGGGRWVHVPA
jgi:hypothetical protein